MAMRDIEPLDWAQMEVPGPNEYHDVATITVLQLVEDGILDSEWWGTWDAYDDAQRDRMWTKFMGRFEYREIGILPPGRWMHRVIAVLNEVMPKYRQLYAAIDSGITVMTDYDEWHKGRDVYSQFPQTALGGANEDYASSGNDREHETVRDHGLLDAAERIGAYNDVDVMILNDLEPLFFALRSTDIAYL